MKKTWEVACSKVDKPYERSMRVIFSPSQDGIQDFSLLLTTLYPQGGATHKHAHQDSGELMYIVSGRGYIEVEDEQIPLEPDVAFFAEAGKPHQLVNTSEDFMKIVCLFVPGLAPEYIKNAVAEAEK